MAISNYQGCNSLRCTAERSDLHLHISILPQNTPSIQAACHIPLSRVTVLYTGPCWLSVLNIAVCTCGYLSYFDVEHFPKWPSFLFLKWMSHKAIDGCHQKWNFMIFFPELLKNSTLNSYPNPKRKWHKRLVWLFAIKIGKVHQNSYCLEANLRDKFWSSKSWYSWNRK